jgi:hypothetical protein
MPLARIVTDVPEEALELATQLRARGFQVETLSSQATPVGIADLEVHLDECAVDDVLHHATEMATGDVGCVFVAPGALEEGGRSSVKTINLLPVDADLVAAKAALQHDRQEIEDVSPATLLHSEPPPVPRAESAIAWVDEIAPQAEPIELQFSAVGSEPLVEPSEAVLEIEKFPAAALIEDAVDEHPVQSDSDPDSRVIEIPTQHTVAESFPAKAHNGKNASSIAIAPPQVLNPARGTLATVTALRSRTEADRAFWRVAVAAAALAAFVVAAGSLWHRLRPFPEHLAAPTSPQAIPFRHVPTNAQASAPNQNGPKPSSPVTASSSPANGSSETNIAEHPNASSSAAAPPLVAPAAPVAPSASSKVIPAHTPSLADTKPAAKRKPARDSELIAEDTVVFYNKKPGAPSAKSASQPGAKQYSDAR